MEPSVGRYATEINHQSLALSPRGSVSKVRETKVLRESITQRYWQKTKEQKAVGEITTGDSAGKIQQAESLLFRVLIFHFRA